MDVEKIRVKISCPGLLGRMLVRSISNHTGWVFGTFLMNFIPIAWDLNRTLDYKVMAIDGIFLLAATYIAVMLMECIPVMKIRKKLFYASFILCFILSGFEGFSILNYDSRIGAGIMMAVLETNLRETLEFIRMYVGWETPAAIGLAVAAILFIRKRFFSRPAFQPVEVCGVIGVTAIVAATVTGTILIREYPSYVKGNFLDIPVVRITGAGLTALDNIAAYKDIDSKMNKTPQIIEQGEGPDTVVLIVGESTARNHMHIYGYPAKNTPYFEKMKNNGELAVFSDVISSHAITIASIREIFTFHDAEACDEWYEYPNMIDIMNAAGYKTHWISNQESSGIWGNTALLFANRCDTVHFTHIRESREYACSKDEELFPLLDGEINDDRKNFYVLHLMGTHGLYYNRYPYLFSKFSASDVNDMELAVGGRHHRPSEQLEIAQYDNAVYYNDYVVDSLIDRFKNKDALVIYISDHGENVYDGKRSIAGHVEENPDNYMLEIPMVIWASPEYRQKHVKKWAAIQAAVNRPYMTDDIIHTVLDIAGIRTPEWNPGKSVISPEFDFSRTRTIDGKAYEKSPVLQQ